VTSATLSRVPLDVVSQPMIGNRIAIRELRSRRLGLSPRNPFSSPALPDAPAALHLLLAFRTLMIPPMTRLASLLRLRAAMAVLPAGAVLLLLGLPVCSSSACPMAKMDRGRCLAMGLDCCRAGAGRVSHDSPRLASPDLAASVQAVGAAAAPATVADRDPARLAPAAPAVIQGVGLHTLFAIFRI